MLYQLKRAGVTQSDLVTVYSYSVVRPVLEYIACPVWHTSLPKYLSDNIETVQKRALKAILTGEHYLDLLNNIGICSLNERRDYFMSERAQSADLLCDILCTRDDIYYGNYIQCI